MNGCQGSRAKPERRAFARRRRFSSVRVALLLACAWACSDAGREPSSSAAVEGAPQAAPSAPGPAAPPGPEAVAPVVPEQAGDEAPTPAPPPGPAVTPEPAPPPSAVPSELPTTEAGAVPAARLGEAPLDLEGLAERLKESKAIGVFTKLKLKNEFDDLREALRAHYAGRNEPSLPELRERYDLLVMKVLAVFDERDVALSRDLLASREAVWTRLNDPAVLAGS